ncbi:unnamed protein product [Cryptosporidium hominis]|uniref:Uncharacterized protein n=1 Tax=Cryptosporidium hominis TaxID=237895 RepID=A0A0S4TCK1_CRYHO|nr:hypothetical protein [Cryptosporidium hominis TU502]PPS92876.1 Uncharacterized protein GY17_00002638 [Cryptosporidium hominis]CUV04967.1 unnamed protein product [Cryptosporidium hominis]|eukprot:PPS92876.1 Uncharacterized protein GY17_00002638 [Cryptosporidium hominis]
MGFSFIYDMRFFLIKFFPILLFSTRINNGLFIRNYEETLIDFSLSQLSAGLESSDGSLRSMSSFLSLESFGSCFSEFQSQSSFYTAPDYDSNNSIDRAPCVFECLYSKREVLTLLRRRNYKELKSIRTIVLEEVMEEIIQKIKSMILNYEEQVSRKESLLAIYNLCKRLNKKAIKKTEKEIKLLKFELKCYLTHFDLYLYILFKHLFKRKIKEFKSTTKDLQSSRHTNRVNSLQREIAFNNELLSLLGAAFLYYLCNNEILENLHLCTFMSKQHLKITKYNEKIISLHKKAIDSIGVSTVPDSGSVSGSESESKLETIPEESSDSYEPF